ncbi:MAG: winged helix DNA-binding domain-containing protein [Acidimicrobiales bacterium]
MATFSPDEARRLRLASLLLAEDRSRAPLEVARWFGAMQGQDIGSLQWSFGVRMAGSTLADVDGAFERAEVLRTWPMRGTVHAIPAEDARWMLALGTPRALQGVERRWATLGIDRSIVEQGCEVLRDLLHGGGPLPRSACVDRLAEAGLATASGHGYHLLWYASQVGVTCMGPQEGKEATFALLDEWAPDQRELDRDESLAEIARRFVRSHGPVPRQDLAGWTGLTQGDAKAAIALAGDELATVEVDGTEMAVSAAVADEASSLLAAHDPARVWALTGFDEYVLGYKDRSLIVDEAHKDQIIPGGNGMFANTIVVDGRAVGTWRRTVRAKRIDVAAQPFGKLAKAQRAGFERAMAAYAAFYGTEAAFTA